MRIIPTHVHAILDYLVGLLLIALPFVVGFEAGLETWLFVIAGLGLFAYSLFTDYEYALARKIPMPVHLLIDVGSGIVLLLAPWLFGFSDTAMWTYVIVGLLEIGTGLMTRTVPSVAAHHPPPHGVRAR